MRIRMTPSTASFCFMKPNCPSRGAWPIATVADVLHEHRDAVVDRDDDVADVLEVLTWPRPRT